MKQIKACNQFSFLLFMAFFCSCASVEKIPYFQDLEPGMATQTVPPIELRVRPHDKISIVVNSKDAELSNLFNLPIVSHRIGTSSERSISSNSQQISGYTVDEQGYIDFPVVGKLLIGGLSRTEIAMHIKQTLIREDLVKDPVVTVEFMNLGISVLGEVAHPGKFALDRDRVTLLDAIAMAGDLTIYGKRESVYVLREEQGVQIPYLVDLTSAGQLYSSPVYYLQQNDVIYIEPNTVKARQSTVNGNNVRSTSFWISLASLFTSVAVLIFK